MSIDPQHEKRFHGSIEFLRSQERIARLELERVVQLSLEGILANSVLDIGTGSGIFAEAFFKQIPAVTGVDVSEEMLERARQMVEGADFQ